MRRLQLQSERSEEEELIFGRIRDWLEEVLLCRFEDMHEEGGRTEQILGLIGLYASLPLIIPLLWGLWLEDTL